MRIAIVDDQKSLCNGLAQHIAYLDDSFKIVGKAFDGYEGEKLIRLAKPDIAFLDIRMPFLSGIDLLERLRSDRTIRTKFVMLTAYSDFEYAQQTLRLGAFDYLLKPVGAASLGGVIRRAAEELQADKPATGDTLQSDASRAGPDSLKAKNAVHARAELDALDGFIASRLEAVIRSGNIRNECVIQTLRIIGAEYMLPLSLHSIALRLHMNESYLSRLFSADMGMPLIKYLNAFRIDIAMEIMKLTDLNVTEVAGVSGFDNITYFGRLFKSHTGYSASSYKFNILRSIEPTHEKYASRLSD